MTRPVFPQRPYAERVRIALAPLKAAGVPWEDAWRDATRSHRPPALDWGRWHPTAADPGIDPLPEGEGEPLESAVRFLHRHMRLAYLNLPGGVSVVLTPEDAEMAA